MTTPDRNSPEMAALLADLNSAFGKKPKSDIEVARARNLKWHERNRPLGAGAVAARPNPEDSTHWRPFASVTHVVRQRCATCNNTTEHIGGEFVKFRSIMPFGGEILRRAEVCPDMFLSGHAQVTVFGKPVDVALVDVVEEHEQVVSRCPGCIAVERKAEELWNKVSQAGLQLDLPLEAPPARKVKEDFGGRLICPKVNVSGDRPFEREWPEAFSKPSKEAV